MEALLVGAELVAGVRGGLQLAGALVDSDPAAAKQLLDLMADPDVSARCRVAAETAYSLETACRDQIRLYRDLSM